jgi:hypothetical protein
VSPQDRKVSSLLWVLGAFLVMLGAKLWLLKEFGTPLPYWDNWDDAHTVFVPYFEGKLSLASLLSPHNEHRLFFTRIFDLGLLVANGQWDNHVLTVVNAVIHSSSLTGLGCLMARSMDGKPWPQIFLPLMLAVTVPFAWDNTFGGFHSMFYFMLLFSLLTIWLLGMHEPFNARWWLGVGTVACSLFTAASGLLGPATVFALVSLRLLREPAMFWRHWPTLVVCLFGVGAGLALKAEVPHHQILKAHSVLEFLVSFGKYLAWPWIVLPPFAIFNVLPLFFLAWICMRDPKACGQAEEIVLGIGIWALLQSAAGAYARGAGGAHPQWRYMDSTSFVVIANAWSLSLLALRHQPRLPFRRYFKAAAGIWVLACLSGLMLLCWRAWTVDIPERQLFFRMQMLTTRSYLATGDVNFLRPKRREYLIRFEGNPALSQDHAIVLTNLLNISQIRSMLPACVRDTLKVLPERVEGFFTNTIALAKPETPGVVIWASLNTNQAAALRGEFASQPIRASRLPYLEIPVAGDLGTPGLSLELIDLASGSRVPVNPERPPGSHWQNLHVKAPPGEFKLVAKDESESGWLAFQEPREIGRLSMLAVYSLDSATMMFFTGIGLIMVAAFTTYATPKSPLAGRGSHEQRAYPDQPKSE